MEIIQGFMQTRHMFRSVQEINLNISWCPYGYVYMYIYIHGILATFCL